MNMNLDHEPDRNELSLYVDDYFMFEFVAVPPDFDIHNYLTLREQTGMFKHDEIELNKIRIMIDSIRCSPVLCLLNNALLEQKAGIYLLSILDELGLVLKSIPNPLRKSMEDYNSFLKRYSESQGGKSPIPTYIRGQEAKRVNIVIVNIFPMMDQHIIDEAMEIAKNLQKYQKEIKENIDKIGKID